MPRAAAFFVLSLRVSKPPPKWNRALPRPAAMAKGSGAGSRADRAVRAQPAAARTPLRLRRSAMAPKGICMAKAQKL